MTDPSRIIIGDVIEGLRTLDASSVQCCVTSPPYWGLRDYGVEGQIGLEKTPEEYVAKMVDVFREVRRVLREDGTLWLNLGDSYNNAGSRKNGEGLDGKRRGGAVDSLNHTSRDTRHSLGAFGIKCKDLCMIPWRVALALQADGWWLRSVIVWAKKSPMPESVTDRPTSSFEPIFLLAKSERYFYDAEAVKEASEQPRGIAEPTAQHKRSALQRMEASTLGTNYGPSTRNQRNVWHLGPEPYAEAHFATFPTEIPRRAIKAGTSEKGCCAACGAGWVRVIEKPSQMMKVEASAIDRFGNGDAGVHRKVGQAYQDWRDANPNKTIGWEPTCTCGAAVVPCLVLDPFLGSGTTVAVARELGRYGVGCELNPEYAKLARDRIGKAEKPSTYRSDRVDDAPLFVP